MRITHVEVNEERGKCAVYLENGERLQNVTAVVASADTEGLPTLTVTVSMVRTHKPDEDTRCPDCSMRGMHCICTHAENEKDS